MRYRNRSWPAVVLAGLAAITVAVFALPAKAQITTVRSISFAARVSGTAPAGFFGINITVTCAGLMGNAVSTVTYGLTPGGVAVPTYWALTGPNGFSPSGTSCAFRATNAGSANLEQGVLSISVGGIDRTNSISIIPGGPSVPATAAATTASVAVYDSTEVVATVTFPDGFSPRSYFPVTPTRVLDSRTGTGTTTHVIAAGETVALQVRGLAGVSATATTAALNVAVTEPSSAGFITVYPCGATRPTASNLNFAAGQTVANMVTAGLSAQGQACLYASASTHLLADISGYFDANGQGYTPLTPSRMFDTRQTFSTPIGTGATFSMKLTGINGVPADARGLVLNVTVTEPGAAGFITVYRCDTVRPTVSNINFSSGQTIANAVYAQLDSSGNACFYVSAATHILADVHGYFGTGNGLVSVGPSRLVDTRTGTPLGAGQTLVLSVRGFGGVSNTAIASILNVTATNTQGTGFLTLYPCDTFRPVVSTLNFTPGVTVANMATARLSGAGQICVYASATTDVIVDAGGFL
jgi:hypothetical protein